MALHPTGLILRSSRPCTVWPVSSWSQRRSRFRSTKYTRHREHALDRAEAKLSLGVTSVLVTLPDSTGNDCWHLFAVEVVVIETRYFAAESTGPGMAFPTWPFNPVSPGPSGAIAKPFTLSLPREGPFPDGKGRCALPIGIIGVTHSFACWNVG
jgi:hypothetical protein